MFPEACSVSCELLILIMEKKEKNEIQTAEEMLSPTQLRFFTAGLLGAFNPLVNTLCISKRGSHHTLCDPNAFTKGKLFFFPPHKVFLVKKGDWKIFNWIIPKGTSQF